MAATLANLLAAVTATEGETTLLALLEAAGFPATSWPAKSFPRGVTSLLGQLFADVKTGITTIAKSRLVRRADGDAIDYLAEHFYLLSRDGALPTQGTFLLTDDGGAPYTIAVGQLLVRDVATSLLFQNIEAGSILPDGELPLTFEGLAAGADYNIGSNAELEFAQTLEGITVTNPPDATSGTWITQAGTDVQSDRALGDECPTRWGTLGAGAGAAYEAWAREADRTIARVKVFGEDVAGAASVLVIISTDAGGASDEVVERVGAFIDARRPRGVRRVQVRAATVLSVPIVATVNVFAGVLTTAEALALFTAYVASLASAIQDLNEDTDIASTMYRSRLQAALHAPGSVRNAALASPAADVVPGFDEIARASVVASSITLNTVSP